MERELDPEPEEDDRELDEPDRDDDPEDEELSSEELDPLPMSSVNLSSSCMSLGRVMALAAPKQNSKHATTATFRIMMACGSGAHSTNDYM